VSALAAGSNLEELSHQISRHHPELVSVATPDLAADSRRAAYTHWEMAKLPEIHHGSPPASRAVATHPTP